MYLLCFLPSPSRRACCACGAPFFVVGLVCGRSELPCGCDIKKARLTNCTKLYLLRGNSAGPAVLFQLLGSSSEMTSCKGKAISRFPLTVAFRATRASCLVRGLRGAARICCLKPPAGTCISESFLRPASADDRVLGSSPGEEANRAAAP